MVCAGRGPFDFVLLNWRGGTADLARNTLLQISMCGEIAYPQRIQDQELASFTEISRNAHVKPI